MAMSSIRLSRVVTTLGLSALAASCMSAKHVDEVPITVLRNGDIVAEPTRTVERAATAALGARLDGRAALDSITAAAYVGCAPDACAAIGQGELALGMTESQVLAATRTTRAAWSARRSGGIVVLSPRDPASGPRDAVASVAMVQLADDRVASVTYREPQGLRIVASESDVRGAGRARAVALSREGDALAAAGDFTSALERYDRASVVDRSDAELQYKMATSLEKLLRPVEAGLRYRLFLHQLELQKIDAIGTANARLGAAMMQARERIVVLEKR
jgi:hypothetical protein